MSLGGVKALVRAVPAGAQEREDAADTEVKVEGHRGRKLKLGFETVPVSSVDEVVAPKGNTAKVLIA